MKMKRIAAVPLVTHDPYFSVWSQADRLYDDETRHWSQEPLRMYGSLELDGREYFFMGRRAEREEIPQTLLEVSATSTRYRFENEAAALEVTFTSPLLPDDLKVFSRPCSYIRFRLDRHREAEASVRLRISADFVRRTSGPIFGNAHMWTGEETSFPYVYMYKGNQRILGDSGDNRRIDWGNVYLAAQKGEAALSFCQKEECLEAEISFRDREEACVVLGFDDILSVHYLDGARSGYWKKYYRNLPEALAACLKEKDEVLSRCGAFDRELEERAKKSGGDVYAFLCDASYRQAMAGHKLIADGEGNPVFLSKECDSNGCIGTVDVSYPSAPLLLCFSPELAEAMLRPIFAFARRPVWCFDFAPHDVGRYPYATGQIYGLKQENRWLEFTEEEGMLYPFYADYPDGREVYDFRTQMPVEECGNMLIMTAAVCRMEGSARPALPHMDTLQKWVDYLVRYGKDPQEQLCTDDFAGHLAHNVNLSAKAIMGIEAYAQICGLAGRKEEARSFHAIAAEYAAYWEKEAAEGDHTLLAYGRPDSWSLKYNAVWDLFFGSHLFSEGVLEREVDFYIRKREKYGVPLDCRKRYAKSDWTLWCSAMTEDPEKRGKLMEPVARFLEETGDRVPFSDWYDAGNGNYCHFKGRTVQGGIFMPMLLDQFARKEG